MHCSHFQQRISMYMPYFKIEILTSPEVTTLLSFEQLGPGDCLIQVASKTGLPVHVPQSHHGLTFISSFSLIGCNLQEELAGNIMFTKNF